MDFIVTMERLMINCYKKISCALFIVSYFSANPSIAATTDSQHFSINFLKKGHLTLQLGGFTSHQGKTQFIHINELIGDQFIASSGTKSNGLLGVGYMIDSKTSERFNLSLGMNWFYLPKTSVSGTVLQENWYENLTYSYNITNYPLYFVAKSKVNLNTPDKSVTLNVGIGPNFMQTSNFKEESVRIPNANYYSLPDTIFSGKTTTTFSATAGIGFQIARVFGDAPLECGYQFFYLGQGSHNIINNQVLDSLKTGQVYSNALMCSIII